MGLFTGLLTLPLAPVRGVAAVAGVIRDEADRQRYDPEVIRRELEDIDRARADGTLSEADAASMEDELIARLVRSRSTAPAEER